MHTREELEAAFTDYQRRVDAIRASGDWAGFAELFTEDATYIEHCFGTFHGRAEIAAWAQKTMSAYPGNVMCDFPIAWHVIDEATSRVICEVRNLMPALPDGEVLEESNITILTYAPAPNPRGLWSCEEDVYNPMKFGALAKEWRERSQGVS